MTLEKEEQLRNNGNLFQEPDSTLLLSSGCGRHWPDSRGIFHNDSQETLHRIRCTDNTTAPRIFLFAIPGFRSVWVYTVEIEPSKEFVRLGQRRRSHENCLNGKG